ncbi:hypothetical protein [Streptomyces sp. NPDC020141]|uniref:hypothetical protein n=1 Tax=Streptomyces sp. NPDC020141 TaxID=3365065 RepID=UPI00378EA70C
MKGITPAEPAEAGIHPHAGSEPGERLDDAAVAYQEPAAFFRAAARLRHGPPVWIA